MTTEMTEHRRIYLRDYMKKVNWALARLREENQDRYRELFDQAPRPKTLGVHLARIDKVSEQLREEDPDRYWELIENAPADV